MAFGSKTKIKPKGSQLVADFQTALVNIATAQGAKFQAELSEHTAIESLKGLPRGANPVFVTPMDVPEHIQSGFARHSVDAHLKKVQAEQIARYSKAQIQQMEQADKQDFIGKKARVVVIDSASKPIESINFDSRTGRYDNKVFTKKVITGFVQDIQFSKNLLVLGPSLMSKLVFPGRVLYAVYVINPDSLTPTVEIQL